MLVRKVRDARQEIYDIRPLPDSRWNKFCQFPGRRPNTASHTSADNGPCENPPPPLPQCQGCMEGTLRTGKIDSIKNAPPCVAFTGPSTLKLGGMGEKVPLLSMCRSHHELAEFIPSTVPSTMVKSAVSAPRDANDTIACCMVFLIIRDVPG